MDDYDDHSDYGDYESGGDDFDEEDYCDDDLSGGEDDGEEEEEVEEEEEEEEEGAGNEMEDYEEEEEEGAGDEMEDYEEEEEIAEYGEENDDHAEVVEDQAGVEVEDEIEEDLVEYEEEEEEEEQEPMEDDEDEEELLEEEDEDEAYGDVGSNEDDSDYEDEIAAAEPFYLPRPRALAPFPTTSSPFLSVADVSRLRSPYIESGLSDLSGDGSGLGSSRSDWRRSQSGDGTASSRSIMNNVILSDGNVVESRGTESSGSNDSNLSGLKGTICSICYECWTGEGEHCVCCLPCGHLYGLSCIKMWLQQPNSQKCPQCNKACELADVRRLYGMQLAITGVEELQQKVKCLEAQCASLVLKDADWLRKEAEWQKKEADLQHQLNQHKEPETGLVKPAMIPGEARKIHDPVDDPEPANALRHMKL